MYNNKLLHLHIWFRRDHIRFRNIIYINNNNNNNNESIDRSFDQSITTTTTNELYNMCVCVCMCIINNTINRNNKKKTLLNRTLLLPKCLVLFQIGDLHVLSGVRIDFRQIRSRIQSGSLVKQNVRSAGVDLRDPRLRVGTLEERPGRRVGRLSHQFLLRVAHIAHVLRRGRVRLDAAAALALVIRVSALQDGRLDALQAVLARRVRRRGLLAPETGRRTRFYRAVSAARGAVFPLNVLPPTERGAAAVRRRPAAQSAAQSAVRRVRQHLPARAVVVTVPVAVRVARVRDVMASV